jgi:hypothetical protein
LAKSGFIEARPSTYRDPSAPPLLLGIHLRPATFSRVPPRFSEINGFADVQEWILSLNDFIEAEYSLDRRPWMERPSSHFAHFGGELHMRQLAQHTEDLRGKRETLLRMLLRPEIKDSLLTRCVSTLFDASFTSFLASFTSFLTIFDFPRPDTPRCRSSKGRLCQPTLLSNGRTTLRAPTRTSASSTFPSSAGLKPAPTQISSRYGSSSSSTPSPMVTSPALFRLATRGNAWLLFTTLLQAFLIQRR